MLRRYVSTAFLSGSLLFGSLVLAPSPSTLLAKAVGAFATVVAIDGPYGHPPNRWGRNVRRGEGQHLESWHEVTL